MLIRCPECQLEREINLDAIPAGAVMATCPRCKMKFRFREPGAASAAATPTPAPTPAPTAAAPSVATAAAPPPPSAETGAAAPPAADPEGTFAAPVRLGDPVARPDRREKAAEHDTPGRPDSARPAPARTEAGRAESLRPESADATTQEAQNEWLDVPWERPDRYGHLMGLYQTVVRVLFNAPRFFASLPRCRGSIMRPLLFYVLLGLFQVVVKLLWFRSIDPSMTDPQVQELLSSADMSLAMTFVVSPGILALQLFLYSSLFFLMLRLVQPEAVTFPVVFRVVAYSAAPLVVCAVPVIGPMVAMVWFAASCFMGCRFALNLPWLKVALALVPLYLIGFAITMQFVQHLLSQG